MTTKFEVKIEFTDCTTAVMHVTGYEMRHNCVVFFGAESKHIIPFSNVTCIDIKELE